MNHLGLVQADAPPLDVDQRTRHVHETLGPPQLSHVLESEHVLELIAQHLVGRDADVVIGQIAWLDEALLGALVNEHLDVLVYVLFDLVGPLVAYGGRCDNKSAARLDWLHIQAAFQAQKIMGFTFFEKLSKIKANLLLLNGTNFKA
jgi:hypothetical protein